MARSLRIEFNGAFYHVRVRGNERGKIYYSSADYEKFKDYLKDGQVKYGYRLSKSIQPLGMALTEMPHCSATSIKGKLGGSICS